MDEDAGHARFCSWKFSGATVVSNATVPAATPVGARMRWGSAAHSAGVATGVTEGDAPSDSDSDGDAEPLCVALDEPDADALALCDDDGVWLGVRV